MPQKKSVPKAADAGSKQDKSTAAPTRTPRERFLHWAPRRVQRIVTELKRLQRCANERSYDYTPEEVKHMRAVLEERLQRTLDAFDTSEEVELPFSFNAVQREES